MNLKFTGHKKIFGNNISIVSFRNKNNEIVYINADEIADKNSFVLKAHTAHNLSYSGICELNLFCEGEADIDINIIQELKTVQKVKIDKIPVKIDFGDIATEMIVNNITGDTVYFNLNTNFKADTSYRVGASQSIKLSEASISFITMVSDGTSSVEILARR